MNLTIKNRLILALAGMLVPLAILSSITFISVNNAVDSIQEILIDPIVEIDESIRLQNLLNQAVMPANDYLVHGRISERLEFAELEKKIEKQYAKVRTNKALLEKQQGLLQKSYERWNTARGLSLKILSLARPVGSRAGADAMEQMDVIFEQSNALVGEIHSIAKKELQEAGSLVGQVKRNLVATIVFVMLIAFAILMSLAYLVGRAILRPVHNLEEGVHGIAEGDYDKRVNIESRDEFGRLATSFNEMAAHLKKAHTQLEELSLRDGLTGILNRRAFDQTLRSETSRSKRFGNEFSLVMFDIDKFKLVNDANGHLFGDDVLIAIAREVEKYIRPVDQFGRFGGEEFVIILPETGIEGATRTAERLRKMIETLGLKNDQGEVVRITASFGIACLPQDAASESELLGLTDKRLYRAKREGRNKIVSTD